MTTDDLSELREELWAQPCPSWCRVVHDALTAEDIAADVGVVHEWWSQDVGCGRRVRVERLCDSNGWEPPGITVDQAADGDGLEWLTAHQAKEVAVALNTAVIQLGWFEAEIGPATNVAADMIGEFAGYLRNAGKTEHTIHNRIVRLRRLGEVVDLVDADADSLAAALGAVEGKLGSSDYTLVRSWCGWLVATSRRASDPTSQLKPVGRRRTASLAPPTRRHRWLRRR